MTARRGPGLVAAALCGLLLAAAAFVPPLKAQTSDVRGLIAEVDRLRRDLDSLQRHVYSGAPSPAGAPAPADGGSAASPGAARLQVRLTELENEMRRLTGRLEEVGFKVDRLGTRLDKLVEDVDFRLSALERGETASPLARQGAPESQASGAPPLGALPPAATPGQGQAPLASASSAGSPAPAPTAGTLGSITEQDLAKVRQGGEVAPSQSAPSPVGAPPPAAGPPPVVLNPPAQVANVASPEEQYNTATRLLRQGDWAGAEATLKDFLQAYPDDSLAPNAHYWLGETYYVRAQYDLAASAFLEGYERYSDGPKAPDSLLKLGMSLLQLGEVKDACVTFATVVDRYGESAGSIARLADRERKRANCS